MQRYANGVKVPREVMEELPFQTTDGTGVIDYILKYSPKSEKHVQVIFADTAASKNRQVEVASLTAGNHIWLRVWKLLSPGGGAECTTLAAANEAQDGLVINYEVT